MSKTEFLEKQALEAAKRSDWKKAIKINQLYLKAKPKNTAALNRLARAFDETGYRHKAVCTYKKVLEIDKYNQIADRNLKKLSITLKNLKNWAKKTAVDVSFLEEKGKTKVIRLIRTAEPEILTTLHFAEELQLVSKRKSVIIKDCLERYVGALPDDVGFRLNRLIEKGNCYAAWVKNVEDRKITIFIRELHCCPELNQTPSFF